jgi:aryl-alcohol dehydrogenase-like predicted oxidoreductase
MKYRTFGRLEYPVSEIGFGAWAIGGSWGKQTDDDSIAALHAALDLGVNFIDTAAVYGDGRSERLIAKVLKDRPARGTGLPIHVATKTPPAPGTWPPFPREHWQDRYPEKYLRENVETRLKNLGVERLDLLQLHTWTRAWNDDPQPFAILRKLQKEGKIAAIGVSTPEHDQDCVIDLMRGGFVDAVQVIYNIFDQEPAAQLLPVAKKTNTAIIARVAFDEGSLTGKFTPNTTFEPDDFRRGYFAGDRLARAVERAAKVQSTLASSGYTMPQAALKFILAETAVHTVIPGIRSAAQAQMNCTISELPDMSMELQKKLWPHNWRRAIWHGGK